MDNEMRVRENKARRVAQRRGLRLVKSARRDPKALDFGKYHLLDAGGHVAFGIGEGGLPVASLTDIEAFLDGGSDGTIPAISVTTGLDAQDKNIAILQIEQDMEPLAHVMLPPPELSNLIEKLGKTRAAMPDQIPPELSPGSRLPFINSPAWHVEQRGAELLVAIRHPGYGWLAFTMPENEADKFSSAVSKT